MTSAKNLGMAWDFASSVRGKYILSKALHYAIGELEKIDGAHRNDIYSDDIIDMKYLREQLYYFPVEPYIG